MRHYKCSACGNTYIKDEMDKDSLYDIDSFLCMSCANELAQAGWDSVDPAHNYSSFEDWDENGH